VGLMYVSAGTFITAASCRLMTHLAVGIGLARGVGAPPRALVAGALCLGRLAPGSPYCVSSFSFRLDWRAKDTLGGIMKILQKWWHERPPAQSVDRLEITSIKAISLDRLIRSPILNISTLFRHENVSEGVRSSETYFKSKILVVRGSDLPRTLRVTTGFLNQKIITPIIGNKYQVTLGVSPFPWSAGLVPMILRLIPGESGVATGVSDLSKYHDFRPQNPPKIPPQFRQP